MLYLIELLTPQEFARQVDADWNKFLQETANEEEPNWSTWKEYLPNNAHGIA